MLFQNKNMKLMIEQVNLFITYLLSVHCRSTSQMGAILIIAIDKCDNVCYPYYIRVLRRTKNEYKKQ